MVILDTIKPLPIRINANKVPNQQETVLLTVIHSNVPIAYAEVYAISPNGSITSIGKSEALGKDDSASAIAYNNGTVRLFVSEAEPGQSGSTSRITYYDFPNAITPSVPATCTTVDQYARDQISAVKHGLILTGS